MSERIGTVTDAFGLRTHVEVEDGRVGLVMCSGHVRLDRDQREDLDRLLYEADRRVAELRTLGHIAAVAATFGAVLAQAQKGTRLFSPPLTAAEATVRHD